MKRKFLVEVDDEDIRKLRATIKQIDKEWDDSVYDVDILMRHFNTFDFGTFGEFTLESLTIKEIDVVQ